MPSVLREEVKTYANIWAKRLLPASSIEQLRGIGLVQRRKQRRRARGHQLPSQTTDVLISCLRDIGLQSGCDVLVHSALSTLGPIEGGAASLFDAIATVVGSKATVLAPAYPMSGTMYDWMSNDEPFDVRHTRSRMGALSEYMRSVPGARRSAHPSHSVVAIGPAAYEYTAQHHEGVTATGAVSPFYLHIKKKGQILCLGSGVGKITSYHVIEDVMPKFPVDAYLKETFKKRVIFVDGQRAQVSVRVNDPKLAPWRVDNFKPKEEEVRDLLLQYGVVREGTVGFAASHLLDGAALFTAMQDWAKHGRTIYHQPKLAFGRNLRRFERET